MQRPQDAQAQKTVTQQKSQQEYRADEQMSTPSETTVRAMEVEAMELSTTNIDNTVVEETSGPGAGARPSSKRPGSQNLSSQAFGRKVTGVAAVASAGIVLPFTADGAIAYENQASDIGSSSEVVVPEAYAASIAEPPAEFSQRALVPQVAQSDQAIFTPGYSAVAEQGFGQRSRQYVSQSTNQSVAQLDTANQVPILSKDAAGNWTVIYKQSSDQETQAVVAQVAQKAQSAEQTDQTEAAGKQADSGYVSAQLPEARRKVASLQKQIEALEADYGGRDLSAYQALLSERIAEISQQRSQLKVSLDKTRKLITQLKTRLVTVNADLGLADQIIAQDTAYQTVWERLKKAEENLLSAFSKVSVDSTALNSVYADYQYHQQWLERTIQESVGNYLAMPGVQQPDFVYRAPAALDVLQNLVVATHEHNVQQLRASTIATIEERLETRRDELLETINEYEALQNDLEIAQQVVARYEQAEGNPVVRAATDSSVPAVTRARNLSLEAVEGSTGKVLLGVVVAAGAIATAVAYRRKSSQKSRSYVPVLSIAPQKGSRTLALQGAHPYEGPLKTQAQKPQVQMLTFAEATGQTMGQLRGQTLGQTIGQKAIPAAVEHPQLAPAGSGRNPSAHSQSTAQMLDELLDITDQSDNSEPALAATTGLLGDSFSEGSFSEASIDQLLELTAEESAPIESKVSSAEGSSTNEETVYDEMLNNSVPGADAAIENLILQIDDVLTEEDTSVELMSYEFDEVINQAEATEPTAQHPAEESVRQTTQYVADQYTTEQTLEQITQPSLKRTSAPIIKQTVGRTTLASRIQAREIAPVYLSLDEIDLFAEYAIRWVLKDLGFIPNEPEQAETQNHALPPAVEAAHTEAACTEAAHTEAAYTEAAYTEAAYIESSQEIASETLELETLELETLELETTKLETLEPETTEPETLQHTAVETDASPATPDPKESEETTQLPPLEGNGSEENFLERRFLELGFEAPVSSEPALFGDYSEYDYSRPSYSNSDYSRPERSEPVSSRQTLSEHSLKEKVLSEIALSELPEPVLPSSITPVASAAATAPTYNHKHVLSTQPISEKASSDSSETKKARIRELEPVVVG